MIAGGNTRGKSGLHEDRVPGNARPGQPEGKRHREETALVSRVRLRRTPKAMVKRWGKSPPRTGQPGRYGKPHPEQCRIGASRGLVLDRKVGDTAAGTLQPRGPGWQLDCLGNKSDRGMVIQRGEPLGQNPAYRPSAQFQSNGAAPCGARKPLSRQPSDKGWAGSLRGGYLSQNERGDFHFGPNIPARRANCPADLTNCAEACCFFGARD